MKPGKRVYEEVRKRRLAFARRHWRRMAVLVAGWVVVGSVALGGVLAAGLTGFAYFLAGGWVVAGAAALGFFLQLEGSFYRRMGGTAEEWTAEEFARLRRYGWETLHNVEFDRFDIDHAVFGPKQVLAVETKYATHPLGDHPSRGFVKVPDGWLDQARRSARKLRLLLKSKGVEQEVTPVLVLWGPGVSSAERSWITHDDVTVLIGARAKEWRAGLRKTQWSKHPTHRARQAVEDYLRRSAASRAGARRVEAR